MHAAVAWYAGNGRIAVSPDRDTALDATVAGWAADVAKGANTAMYAWRRANVAELNSGDGPRSRPSAGCRAPSCWSGPPATGPATAS